MRLAGLTLVAAGALATAGLLATESVRAADGQSDRPTITATVTLPPGRAGGNEHPSPDTPDREPPPCVAAPSPANVQLVQRFDTITHHSPSGLDVELHRYYLDQQSLHRYDATRDRFQRLF